MSALKEKTTVGGVDFTVATLPSATAWTIESGKEHRPLAVRLGNAYSVVLANRDPLYMRVLNGVGETYPDGAPVAAAMRLQHARTQARRVRGPSLFCKVLDEGRHYDLRHFFLGATPETLDRLEQNLLRRYPGLHVTGTFAPRFGPVDDALVERCAAEVRATDADLVWVALGTPKQDFLAEQLAAAIGRTCVGVGAAFDFVAGTVEEAPTWVQKAGLEWLYRLSAEPGRLWRRYVLGNPLFVVYAVASWLRRKGPHV